ncbi:hypothetical protein D3C76_1740130 [compost metagenome]
MIFVDREVGRGIEGNFVELIIRARDRNFTVQVDARTFGREETTVEAVVRPAIVEGEVICGKPVIIIRGAGRLSDRVQITPHCHLRLHVGQVVMHIT